jgi:L-iditol 2-dehydrogenase
MTPDADTTPVSLPPTMRAAVLHGPHHVELERRARPEPGPREVLVRVLAVGTCGSDTHYYEQGRIGEFVVRQPLVLGHEAAGEVAAVGTDVAGLQVGTRVSIEPGVPCFTCAHCRAGAYNLCPQMVFFGTPPVDGAFCEYVLVHEAMLTPVPPEVSDDAAALFEPVSVAIWACRKAGITPGQRVLVTGAGPIGLLVAQTAAAFGAVDVTITDVNLARLGVAERLGVPNPADVRQTSLGAIFGASRPGPDVLIECSGVPSVVAEAVRCLAPGGRAVLVGMGADDVSLPVSRVQAGELTVTGTFRYANTWPTALELVRSGRVDVESLVTHHVGLAEVEQALTMGHQDPDAIKVVVRPQV